MRKILLVFVVFNPLFLKAQSDKQAVTVDSVTFYKYELRQLKRKTYDSLYLSEKYISLVNKIKQQRLKSNNYSGPVLFYDIVHANYKKFNESIVASGFSPMNPFLFRVGFGISSRNKRKIFDFYFATIGFNTSSSNGNEKIRTSLSNVLQLNWGYDLLTSKRFSLYPFIGYAFRLSTLKYTGPTQTNSNYTNITNIVVNNREAKATSFRLGYQVGLGMDYVLAKSKDKELVTRLFVKAGTNSIIGREKYYIKGIIYKPGIRQGDWLITIGMKFGFRG